MLSMKSDNKAATIQASDLVKAVAVIPGKPNTIHLRDVPKPRIGDVPGGRGVLVKILRVGVDGTDKEINAAERKNCVASGSRRIRESIINSNHFKT